MKHITTEQAKIAFCKSQCPLYSKTEIISCVKDEGCVNYNCFVKTLKRMKGAQYDNRRKNNK